jgi:hypothetical protein
MDNVQKPLDCRIGLATDANQVCARCEWLCVHQCLRSMKSEQFDFMLIFVPGIACMHGISCPRQRTSLGNPNLPAITQGSDSLLNQNLMKYRVHRRGRIRQTEGGGPDKYMD